MTQAMEILQKKNASQRETIQSLMNRLEVIIIKKKH